MRKGKYMKQWLTVWLLESDCFNPGSDRYCRQSPWISHLISSTFSFPMCKTPMRVLWGLNRVTHIKCLAQTYGLAHSKRSISFSYYLRVMLCNTLALILRHLVSHFNVSETKTGVITTVLANDFIFSRKCCYQISGVSSNQWHDGREKYSRHKQI